MKKKKINISNVDLKSFPVEEMSIDEYWYDLYNPKIQKIKKRR